MKHTRFTIDDILSPQFGQQQRRGRRSYVEDITTKHRQQRSLSKSTESSSHNTKILFYKTSYETTDFRASWTDSRTSGQTIQPDLKNYQFSTDTVTEGYENPQKDNDLFARKGGRKKHVADSCLDMTSTKRFCSKTEKFQSQIENIHSKNENIHSETELFHSKIERFQSPSENEYPAREKLRRFSGTGSEEEGCDTVDSRYPREGDTSPREEKPTLWPAWVYCTRYSDRPSAGPRVRKIQKKEKVSDEKRPRTAFTSDQLENLKTVFETSHYLTEDKRRQLASDLGLNEAQIKIWFQNKRAKLKKMTSNCQPLAEQLMAQGLYNHKTVKPDHTA